MDLEMFRSMTPEEKAKTLRDPNLVKNVESQFAKPLSMETTYEKNLSPYSTYTQNGKISERVGRLLNNLAGNPKGMGRKDADTRMELEKERVAEELVRRYEAQRKMDEYTGVNVKSAKAADTRMELEKERVAEELVRRYEAPRKMGLLEEEEPSKAGVIMTPEVVKELEEKRQKLIQTRMDLERERRMNEYDQRARARRMRVQDTLEKTGLDRR